MMAMPADFHEEIPAPPAAFIHDLANAYQSSQVLFLANSAGLFSFLETAHGREEIAAHLNWSLRGTRMILDALAGLGLVTSSGLLYRNSPAASRYLVPGRPGYQGDFLRHTARTAAHWADLETCVRTGHSARKGRHRPGSPEWKDYAGAMRDIGAISVSELLAAIDLSHRQTLLDLGAGPGAYAVALLQAYPALRITLMDEPGMLEQAAKYAADAGVLDRCRFRPGDGLTDSLGPVAYDAVLLSNVLHSLSPAACQNLIQRCYNALKPGGTLLVRDFLRGADAADPLFTRLFTLQMLIHTEDGGAPRVAEVAEWAERAGFAPGECVPLGRKSRLWRARRPDSPGGQTSGPPRI